MGAQPARMASSTTGGRAPPSATAALDAFTHQRPPQAQVLEAEGELGLDVLQHELGVGMLKDETDARAQLARELRLRVKATHDDPATECSTGAVRHETVEAAK